MLGDVTPRAVLVLVSLAVGVTGCADITSISRRTDLGDGAKAIHLDAKQRLVMTWDNGSYYCAEPNPDALATVASSLGGGVSVSGEGAGSIATALSENAGSIGLRTQSITLLRDAMYRICEAGYNEQISPNEIAQLHARMQNLMVGLLAIEQLTGAVAAKQVILTGDARARSSAAVLDTDAARKAAEQRVKQAEARVKRAEAQLNSSRTAAEKAQQNFDGPPCNGAVPPDTADNHKLCADQQKKKSDTASQLADDQEEFEDAMLELSDAKEQQDVIQANHDAAMTQASATAAGSGQFSEPATSNVKVDEKTAKHVAEAVAKIVNTIVLTNEALDLCGPLVSASLPAMERTRYVTMPAADQSDSADPEAPIDKPNKTEKPIEPNKPEKLIKPADICKIALDHQRKAIGEASQTEKEARQTGAGGSNTAATSSQ